MEQVPPLENLFEKADKLVKETIKNLRENPIYGTTVQKQKEKLSKEWQKLRASASNERDDKQIKEFIENGLAEELFKTETFNPDDVDFYVASMENGYRIQTSPVYGETNNVKDIISYRYIKTPNNPTGEQLQKANEINTKYEKEYHESWYNSCKMKEELFNEKVKEGEMVFVGEMLFDEYIKLRTSNAPESHQVKYELTPVFDENKITWSKDKNRIYAYTGVVKDPVEATKA